MLQSRQQGRCAGNPVQQPPEANGVRSPPVSVPQGGHPMYTAAAGQRRHHLDTHHHRCGHMQADGSCRQGQPHL
jgi:hypothetical protein